MSVGSLPSSNKHVVTGGLGFVGTHLVRRLLEKPNSYVTVVDDKSRTHDPTTIDELNRDARVRIVTHDLRDPIDSSTLTIAFENAVVWHLAAINGTKNFYKKPRDVLDVGIRSILNVVEACEINSSIRLILASSSEVYHEPARIPTLEDEPFRIPDPTNPRYSYALSKMVSEMYAHHSNVDHVVFRPHNFFGPGAGYDHVIPEVTRKLLLAPVVDGRKQLELPGTGTETRSFCHIADGVAGLYLAGTRGDPSEVYNVGTQVEIAIRDLVEEISSIMGFRTDVRWNGDSSSGATTRRCPDITKIRALGFEPKVDFRQGLKETIQWYVHDMVR